MRANLDILDLDDLGGAVCGHFTFALKKKKKEKHVKSPGTKIEIVNNEIGACLYIYVPWGFSI